MIDTSDWKTIIRKNNNNNTTNNNNHIKQFNIDDVESNPITGQLII